MKHTVCGDKAGAPESKETVGNAGFFGSGKANDDGQEGAYWAGT